MNKPFDIIFNDEYLVVLNKIAKILVVPSPKKEKNTLTSLLKEELNEEVFPCHRLDRETTGLIVYAKSVDIQQEVMQQFKQAKVEKKYIAFVRGKMTKRGRIEGEVLDKEGKKFGERSKKARTDFKVISYRKDFSVVELRPMTGRTNQLRIQLAGVDHPILGERKYAFGRDFKVKFKRVALHASFLSFIHPVSSDRLKFSLSLAEDMQAFLKQKA